MNIQEDVAMEIQGGESGLSKLYDLVFESTIKKEYDPESPPFVFFEALSGYDPEGNDMDIDDLIEYDPESPPYEVEIKGHAIPFVYEPVVPIWEPAVPAVPAVPDVPDVPAVPDVPDVPDVPESTLGVSLIELCDLMSM